MILNYVICIFIRWHYICIMRMLALIFRKGSLSNCSVDMGLACARTSPVIGVLWAPIAGLLSFIVLAIHDIKLFSTFLVIWWVGMLFFIFHEEILSILYKKKISFALLDRFPKSYKRRWKINVLAFVLFDCIITILELCLI